MVDVILPLIIVSIVVPMVIAFFVLRGKSPYNVSVVGSLVSFLSVAGVAVLYITYNLGNRYYSFGYYGFMTLGLVVDALSILVGIMVSLNGLLTIVFSKEYMSPANKEHPIEPSKTHSYYSWLLIFKASALGFIFSSTFLSMIIFFELTSLCSWALIGFYGTPESKKAGLEAFIITHIAAMGLYVATGIVAVYGGSLDIRTLGVLPELAKTMALICVFISAMGKSAQVPFHVWLPHAMVAPTPVSAYLHAAAMVKLGVYMLIRILVEAGFTPVVSTVCIVVGLISMLYGCFMYFPQRDLKKLLAYSTISQLAYILTGIGIASQGSILAMKGVVLHLFNHGFAKELFFLSVGMISFSMGTRYIDQIRGLRKSKIISVGFTVAALAVAGMPPFNCFWSKLLIILGGFYASTWQDVFASIVMLFESVLCFSWLLRIITQVVIGEPTETVEKAQPIPFSMKIVVIILTLLVIASPVLAAPYLNLIQAS